MYAIEAVKQAASASGTPITHIGVAMGKQRTYVNTLISKGTTPQADNLAAMLDVCGYKLVAVPGDSVPEGALVIDGGGERQRE